MAASQELRKLGYTVLGGDNLVFGDDHSEKARYQLGGTITHVTLNTYAPLAGDFSEARIAVNWQVLDGLRNEIVFTAQTQGYGKEAGTRGGGVILSAFSAALRSLTQNPDFVNLLTGPATVGPPAVLNADAITLLPCATSTKLRLPDDIESVLLAVVLIRVGRTHASGVVASEDGKILTAAHVVAGVREVAVEFKSGLELVGKVLRVEEAQDIALVQVPGMRHRCLPLELDTPPPVGTELYAVGAPASRELAFTVTKGIVSGRREHEGIAYLQTDASLNPGNSGGPLLSANGRVVGIVSWKIPGFEGLAFGVPTDLVMGRLGLRNE